MTTIHKLEKKQTVDADAILRWLAVKRMEAEEFLDSANKKATAA